MARELCHQQMKRNGLVMVTDSKCLLCARRAASLVQPALSVSKGPWPLKRWAQNLAPSGSCPLSTLSCVARGRRHISWRDPPGVRCAPSHTSAIPTEHGCRKAFIPYRAIQALLTDSRGRKLGGAWPGWAAALGGGPMRPTAACQHSPVCPTAPLGEHT